MRVAVVLLSLGAILSLAVAVNAEHRNSMLMADWEVAKRHLKKCCDGMAGPSESNFFLRDFKAHQK